MPTFKDSLEREWVLSLDALNISAVRNECKLDLAAIDGSAHVKLIEDDVALVGTLWTLCREQAIAKQISEQAFKAGMCGDALDRSFDCLKEAIELFFPSRKRGTLKAIVAKQEEMYAAATKVAMEKLGAMNPKEAMEKLTQLSSASTLPELSELVPKD